MSSILRKSLIKHKKKVYSLRENISSVFFFFFIQRILSFSIIEQRKAKETSRKFGASKETYLIKSDPLRDVLEFKI